MIKHTRVLLILPFIFLSVFTLNADPSAFENRFNIEVPKKLSQAPAFSAATILDGEFVLDQQKGKVVMLNFWATWCIACVRELPHFQEFYQNIDHEKVVVVAINVREPVKRIQRFLKRVDLDFPIVLDLNGDIYRKYGVSVFPTTYIIDPDGQFRGRVLGDRDWRDKDFKAYILQLAH